MIDEPRDHQSIEVPDGWDQLSEAADDEVPEVVYESDDEPDDAPAIPLIAGSWGDLALILGLCATALMALKAGGHGADFAAAGWALALAVLWWVVAAGALVTIRHGTPGMLMAGVQFSEPVAPGRVGSVVVVALFLCVTLGIPTAIGRPGWALRLAAGSELRTTGHGGP
jgi:hypothetical protein